MKVEQHVVRSALRGLLIERERVLQQAEANIARARLEEVHESSAEARAHAAALHLSADEHLARTRAASETVEPLLNDLASGDIRAVQNAVDGLAEGVAARSAVTSDEALIDALADPSVPLSIGGERLAADDVIRARELERLGPLFDPPAAWSEAAARAIGVRSALNDEPQDGVQLARPGAFGVLYDHHGVLLADGSVVHFTGEAKNKSRARVRRETYAQFLSHKHPDVVESISPHRVRSRQVTSMRPSIVALRALTSIGRADYAFLNDNCEHFANWAGLGASHSSQTRFATQLRRAVRAVPALAPVLEELFAQDVSLSRGVADVEVASPRDVIVLDLGRGYWSPDLEDIVLRLPFWETPQLAPATVDHQWRAGALSGELTPGSWEASNPATLVSRDRHWSLVAVVAGAWNDQPGRQELAWISSEGTWRREVRSPAEIFEARLEHVSALFDALGESLVETLSRAAALITRNGSRTTDA